MTTLLPDFSQATFESEQPIDNQYFPLTPGTVLSYQGAEYELEEIIEAVAGEIGNEIAEGIVEELGGDGFDEVEEGNLVELADEIEDELEDTIDELVDDVIEEIGDELGEFDGAELAEAIKVELIEDVTEELTGKEIESETEYSDVVEDIVDELDDGIDELAVEIADEITEAQADLFATESNQVFVTYDTKNILGVEATVVRDVAWNEGVLVEDTLDWYAQDTAGNVWYLGELATNYEYDDEGNFIGTNTDGSWEAGVDGANPGYLMEANPQVGDKYYQEFYQGEAEDEGEIVSLNESVEIGLGDYENVLKTRDFTNLEPDVFAFKYYAPGIGQILEDEEITEEGGEPELSPELVGISEIPNVNLPTLSTASFEDSAVINHPYFTLTPGTLSIYEGKGIDSDTGKTETERNEVLVTDETKDILGISSRVVKEQEFDGDLLSEEQLSYYAQDTAGNVWLLGEETIEYEYDEEGNVIETDDDDSWLAGEDQALPGLIMDGTPEVGEGYYQRFDLGEAEEQAEIVNLDAAIDDFGDYQNILQVKEFSALETDGFEFEYYAPGVGQIYSEEFNVDGDLIFESSLVSVENINESTLFTADCAELV